MVVYVISLLIQVDDDLRSGNQARERRTISEKNCVDGYVQLLLRTESREGCHGTRGSAPGNQGGPA